MNEFLLNGLDGGNPLGFLASVGALRTATMASTSGEPTLHWLRSDGAWRPLIRTPAAITEDEWLESLSKSLRSMDGHPAFALSDNLNVPVPEFRRAAKTAQDSVFAGDRRFADFIAAFGSEVIETTYIGKRTGTISDTAFRTMSGSGHQHFLGTMRTFAADTQTEHLRRALFHPWNYDDPLERHSMRWDPTDDVRYALRWRNPSGDPSRRNEGSMWGANRLAIEALPLFPTAPTGSQLETTGFRHKRREGFFLTWPIWSAPLSIDPTRSLMALSEIQEDVPDRRMLSAMGIEEVMRCQRLTQGKFRNFSTAWPV